MLQMSAFRRLLACDNLDTFCHTLNTIILIVVDRLDRSPAALFVFGSICNICKTVLDIGALMLVCHQDPIMGSCNNHIFGSHHYHRNSKHIDRMAVLTGVIPCHITDAILRHLLGQCVPCPQILPQIRIFDRHDALPVL